MLSLRRCLTVICARLSVAQREDQGDCIEEGRPVEDADEQSRWRGYLKILLY